MKKRLIVCGDSFSALSLYDEFAGQHYSELMAQDLDWELTNFARQGCSNGGIRIQIDEAIKYKPDFVVLVPTFWDRMEIPATAAPYNSDAPKYDTKTNIINWNHPLQDHLQNTELKNGYDPADGLNNVNYGTNQYNMICETIFSLASNYPHQYRSSKIDTGTQEAIKQYINFIYDSNWKKQQDRWIIRDGIMQMYYAGIKFLVGSGALWQAHEIRQDIPTVIDNKYLITDSTLTPHYATNKMPFTSDMDPGYHGGVESQRYLARKYVDIIRDNFLL